VATKPDLKTVAQPKPDTKAVKVDTTAKPAVTTDTIKTTPAPKPAVVVPPPPVPDTSTATGGGGQGYLQVFSKPAAKIIVDGTDTGKSTPVSGHSLALPAGKHKVTFVIGDDRFTYPVVVKAGQTETMSKDLE